MRDKTVLLHVEEVARAADKDVDFFVNGHDLLMPRDVLLLCKIARASMAVMQKVPTVTTEKKTPLARDLKALQSYLDEVVF